MNNIRDYSSYALLLFLSCPYLDLNAQEVLLHDFDDGALSDWVDHEDFAAGQPFGPTQLTTTDGHLLISSNGPAPSYDEDPSAFFRVTWGPSIDNTEFTNGFLRATVGAQQDQAHAGFILRGGLDPNEVDYEFWRDASTGSFYFARWEKNTEFFEVLASTDDAAIPWQEGEQWTMEAGVVGSEISLKYWQPGEPEPSAPQLTAIDTGIPPFAEDASIMELAVTHFSEATFPVSASFDDVYFTTIPEPTSLSLTGSGALCFALRRRRQS